MAKSSPEIPTATKSRTVIGRSVSEVIGQMVGIPRTNMQVLRPSRRPLSQGDIFVLRPSRTHPYYFGRVINPRASIEGMPAVLIYLYNSAADDMLAVPPLRRDELLVPPLFTNRLPWSRGYFLTVKSVPLTRWDTLPRHVFRDSIQRWLCR